MCPFTDIRRVSDITIAVYWGIEKYAPEWMDPKGVSVILVDNKKGENLLKKCKDQLEYKKRPKEESLNEQQPLSEPVQFDSETRKKFWDEYKKHGFEYVMNQLK